MANENMIKTAIIKGHHVTYEVTGKGYPVFFIHGFGEDRSVWDEFILPFTGNFQIIRPDLPGFGDSPAWEGVTIDDMGTAVHAIQDDMGIKKCIIIGHSMGGYLGLSFAEHYGDRLDGLGLFHSHPYADTDAKKEGRKQGIEFLQRNGAEAFVKQLAPKLFGETARSKFKPVIEAMIKKGIAAGPKGLIESLKAMSCRPDRSDVLKNLNVPVLFIIGKEDELIPWEYSSNQTPLPKVAIIQILENVGHAGMFEAKEETQEVVMEFLAYCLTIN